MKSIANFVEENATALTVFALVGYFLYLFGMFKTFFCGA